MSQKIGKGRTQLFAVEKYSVEDEVLKLYKERMPATKISTTLKKKGIKISPLGINRWLSNQRNSDVTETAVESRKKFEMVVVDYKTEIKDILDEVKEIKKIAKEEKKLDVYVKLVGKLYQGIELLAKLMGDIKPKGNVDINIIINEINKQTFDEKKGMRNLLHNTEKVINVEAEIIEEDKKREQELKGE